MAVLCLAATLDWLKRSHALVSACSSRSCGRIKESAGMYVYRGTRALLWWKVPAMPRYFFHLRNENELHEDSEGMDLPNLNAALDEALRTERELNNQPA